jgi:DJ-1/PfpI family.
LGQVSAADGNPVPADMTFFNTASVLHDALYIPGGAEHANNLLQIPEAVAFINEQYRHCKILGADLDTAGVFDKLDKTPDDGIINDGDINAFIEALKQHRFWERNSPFSK